MATSIPIQQKERANWLAGIEEREARSQESVISKHAIDFYGGAFSENAFMRRVSLLFIILISFDGRVISQTNDSPGVVISHVFFCIDSTTYQNLFKHEFIASLFANTSESSGKTLTDSWTGKYLNGRKSYIEVFATNEAKKHPQSCNHNQPGGTRGLYGEDSRAQCINQCSHTHHGQQSCFQCNLTRPNRQPRFERTCPHICQHHYSEHGSQSCL